MTDRIPELHLADLRRIASGTDWSPPQPGDLADLIAEVDRLTAELADSQAECGALQGELIAAHGVRDAMHRRAYAAQQALREIRGLAVGALDPHGTQDSAQPHAERPTAGFAPTEMTEARNEPQRPAEGVEPSPYRPLQLDPAKLMEVQEWANRYWYWAETHTLEHALSHYVPCGHEAWWLVADEGGILGCMVCGPAKPPIPIELRVEGEPTPVPAHATVKDGMASWVDWDGPTAPTEAEPASEATGDTPGPQKPAQAVAALRWHYGPTDADPNPGSMWCYACGGEVWSFKDGTLACTKCNATEEPDAIAPEDEGIATADVHAQAAADARTDLRTPEQWEAHYGITVRDPDGWRADNQPWEQPITLPDFWRRIIRSTAGPWAPEIYDRMLHDVNNASAATDGGEPR